MKIINLIFTVLTLSAFIPSSSYARLYEEEPKYTTGHKVYDCASLPYDLCLTVSLHGFPVNDSGWDQALKHLKDRLENDSGIKADINIAILPRGSKADIEVHYMNKQMIINGLQIRGVAKYHNGKGAQCAPYDESSIKETKDAWIINGVHYDDNACGKTGSKQVKAGFIFISTHEGTTSATQFSQAAKNHVVLHEFLHILGLSHDKEGFVTNTLDYARNATNKMTELSNTHKQNLDTLYNH